MFTHYLIAAFSAVSVQSQSASVDPGALAAPVSAQQAAPVSAQQTALASARQTADPAGPSYVPHRVYNTKRKRFVDFEAMLADVMYSDMLFLGEQHDDPGTHRLQLAALEGLARRRSNVLLSLEMFERDVQGLLDSYLAGATSEADFLAGSRPWPAYRTDYRPMVEFARAWKWPVIASNVPRRHASLVARVGMAGLDSLASVERGYVARDMNCPLDEYYTRFAATMGDMRAHSPPGTTMTEEQADAMLKRTYYAQCVKDETMGESIAAAMNAAPPRPLVVHMNGAFHSNYRLGTVPRAADRMKGKRVSVVTFVPVANLDTANAKEMRKIGDYVVFTLAPPRRQVLPAGQRQEN